MRINALLDASVKLDMFAIVTVIAYYQTHVQHRGVATTPAGPPVAVLLVKQLALHLINNHAVQAVKPDVNV